MGTGFSSSSGVGGFSAVGFELVASADVFLAFSFGGFFPRVERAIKFLCIFVYSGRLAVVVVFRTTEREKEIVNWEL